MEAAELALVRRSHTHTCGAPSIAPVLPTSRKDQLDTETATLRAVTTRPAGAGHHQHALWAVGGGSSTPNNEYCTCQYPVRKAGPCLLIQDEVPSLSLSHKLPT